VSVSPEEAGLDVSVFLCIYRGIGLKKVLFRGLLKWEMKNLTCVAFFLHEGAIWSYCHYLLVTSSFLMYFKWRKIRPLPEPAVREARSSIYKRVLQSASTNNRTLPEELELIQAACSPPNTKSKLHRCSPVFLTISNPRDF
jgi:hypothetical protein